MIVLENGFRLYTNHENHVVMFVGSTKLIN